jgi:hypothetical protein
MISSSPAMFGCITTIPSSATINETSRSAPTIVRHEQQPHVCLRRQKLAQTTEGYYP